MAKGAFSRISDILKSNINEMLDRAEEPDKMIRQMVRDMEEAVGKATASVGTAVANHKRLERQFNDKQSQIAEWQRKAERAVEAGEDALARRALERKAVFAKAAEDLAPAVEESRQTAEQLREQLRELKTKLEEARTRQGTLIARHQAAQARKRWPRAFPGWVRMPFPALNALSRKSKRARQRLPPTWRFRARWKTLRRRSDRLEVDHSVDDELKALKDKMNKDK